MAKIPIWKTIAERITKDIAKGHYQPGTKLPTESKMAERFLVNRHTVRHAISALVDEGLVYTRRGSGAFVAIKPVRYNIGKRVRFHQSIKALGRDATKLILSAVTRPADQEERRALGLNKDEKVHVVEGIGLIDETPVSHFLAVFPAARFPNMLNTLSKHRSFTKSFAAAGVLDYTRAETRIAAVVSNATTAKHLNLRPGSVLLRSISINVDLDGKAIEFGRTWFSGDHIEMIVEH